MLGAGCGRQGGRARLGEILRFVGALVDGIEEWNVVCSVSLVGSVSALLV